ncbi:MAG: hypothetical protein GX248_06775 [Peptococcaceae bacterium]|jgi:uncharacterized Fe-S cluster protein YjdI|nr:hypothetical protein [Peptococcaceae bacterium]
MRTYQNQDLIVYWKPENCIHVANCIHNLPSVFNKKNRPWIDINGASPEEIIKLIDTCPSGALSYSLPEGSRVDPDLGKGPGSLHYRHEAPQVEVRLMKNGPILIKGPSILYDESGAQLKTGDAFSLCRCGKTKNPPFCDGSHRY